MSNIKILDCTLRDGGYVNNWEFGFENIQKIIDNLTKSKVDYIECGFLKNIEYNKNLSLFDKVSRLNDFIFDYQNLKTKYCLMLNYGDIELSQIEKNQNTNIFLRLCFKKDDLDNALEFSKKLIEKEYDVFLALMHIHKYSKNDLEKLVQKINKINPKALSIVDTIGVMRSCDIELVFDILDNSLNKEISFCFHSHNNLELSYSCAKCLIEKNYNRELILDSTLYSIGRGAGNLAIEEIIKNFSLYDSKLINQTIEEIIKPIYLKTPWGNNSAYFLSAKYKLHPNYAKFLIDKKLQDDKIEKIFMLISEDKKEKYDVNLIEKLYNEINS